MDSLIGTVPDSWAHARLGDVCDILAGPSGARLALEPRTSSNIAVVVPRDLRNNKIAEDGSTAVAPRLADELSRYRLSSGDVVCSRTGDLGRQALAGHQEQEGCAAYLTYYLGHPAVRDWVNRNATGSAILSLNSTKTLGLMPVVLPPLAVQSVAAEVLGALDEKIAVYDEISRTTAALRDSLLPLLLVGPVGTALL